MVIVTNELTLSMHTGTHVDAPFHFFPDGVKLGDIPLEQFVGRAVVLDIRHAARMQGRINWADVDTAHDKKYRANQVPFRRESGYHTALDGLGLSSGHTGVLCASILLA